MTDNTLCPVDCPFLYMRSFMPDTLPFYCGRFDVFLGANSDKKIIRCNLCCGKPLDVVQAGLAFIESYVGTYASIADTREAFLQMTPADQRTFVDVVSKTGRQITIPFGEAITPHVLMDAVATVIQEQRAEQSDEQKAFNALLDDAPGGRPPRQRSDLLNNLFSVLDASERAMLMAILKNKSQAESFLRAFAKTPQDRTFLANVRALIYSYEREHDRIQENRLQHQRHIIQKMGRSRGG